MATDRAPAPDLVSPLSYIEVELESYIPSGWRLADEPSRWDQAKGVFRVQLLDGSDLDWELLVTKKEADQHGRIEALRRAVDRLDRERFRSFL